VVLARHLIIYQQNPSSRRFQKKWIQYIVRTYWLPRKATSNQNARPWMVPACVMTNDNGISMLWRSDSSAVWKFTVCFCVRDKQIRISKVSCTTQHQRLTDLFPQRWRQFDSYMQTPMNTHAQHHLTPSSHYVSHFAHLNSALTMLSLQYWFTDKWPLFS